MKNLSEKQKRSLGRSCDIMEFEYDGTIVVELDVQK